MATLTAVTTDLEGMVKQYYAPSRNADKLAYMPDDIVLEYTSASSSTSATIEIDIPASASSPFLLLDVIHVVLTAFDQAASVEVGDGSSAGLYLDTDDITANIAGNVGTCSVESLGSIVPVWCTTGKRIVLTVLSGTGIGSGLLIARVLRLHKQFLATDSTDYQKT